MYRLRFPKQILAISCIIIIPFIFSKWGTPSVHREVAVQNPVSLLPDNLTITNIYYYRNIGVRYDSVTAGCFYGEMFIPDYLGGQDSLQINWLDSFPPPGIDTTAEYLNAHCQSGNFILDENTYLSFFRMILMTFEDTTVNYSLPDSTAWIIELWNANPAAMSPYIATIDSVGICRAINYDRSTFPPIIGFADAGYEMASIDLSQYYPDVDSAYIMIKIKNFNTQRDSFCGAIDYTLTNTKYTEMYEVFSKKESSTPPELGKDFKIAAFPNPMSVYTIVRAEIPYDGDVVISMIGIDGATIKQIHSGKLKAGVYYYPYQPPSLSAGTYFIRLTDERGVILANTKINYIK